jgi:hypothetical protein
MKKLLGEFKRLKKLLLKIKSRIPKGEKPRNVCAHIFTLNSIDVSRKKKLKP